VENVQVVRTILRIERGDGEILELPMSRADIADNLGLTIETVSRTFSSLRKDRVIELKPHHDVLIPRFADLEQVGG